MRMKNREARPEVAPRQISRADIAAGYAEILGTSDGTVSLVGWRGKKGSVERRREVRWREGGRQN